MPAPAVIPRTAAFSGTRSGSVAGAAAAAGIALAAAAAAGGLAARLGTAVAGVQPSVNMRRTPAAAPSARAAVSRTVRLARWVGLVGITPPPPMAAERVCGARALREALFARDPGVAGRPVGRGKQGRP